MNYVMSSKYLLKSYKIIKISLKKKKIIEIRKFWHFQFSLYIFRAYFFLLVVFNLVFDWHIECSHISLFGLLYLSIDRHIYNIFSLVNE